MVEAFFVDRDRRLYVEVEMSPLGQHLVLLLDGSRNIIKRGLPMEYQAQIGENNVWFEYLDTKKRTPFFLKILTRSYLGSDGNYSDAHKDVSAQISGLLFWYPDFCRILKLARRHSSDIGQF